MLKTRFLLVAAAAVMTASCSQYAAPAQPAPGDGARVDGAVSFPFEVPEGAQFVARRPGAQNIYAIRDACRPLESMNPSRVVFFWNLDAAHRAGYQLSDEEGCS